jgi:aspartate kinase
VALYGKGFSDRPELLSDAFSALAERGINLEMIVETPESLCCILAKSRSEEALDILKERFDS